jgi:3'-5' exonuclease
MVDPRFIVQRYAQLKKLPIGEQFDNDTHVYTIQLGDYIESVETHTTKQAAKTEACRILIDKFPHIEVIGTAPRPSMDDLHAMQPGEDYIAYSRATVLQKCRIHYNDESFFEQQFDTVAFDSEGRPLRLAQFCCDDENVYIFDLPKYTQQVKGILTNPAIKKIVCDIRSEELSFGVEITNYLDIQDMKSEQKKSLVACIQQQCGVTLKKNKRIHIHGWDHNNSHLSRDCVDYAAADALWTYLCGNHE